MSCLIQSDASERIILMPYLPKKIFFNNKPSEGYIPPEGFPCPSPKIGPPVDRINRKYEQYIIKQRISLNPYCQSCIRRNNSYTLATQIDHIVPLFLGGKNELNNLQSLCNSCHQHKSKQEYMKHIMPGKKRTNKGRFTN